MSKLLVGVVVLIVLGLLSWKLGGTTSEWNDAEIFVYPATIKRQSGFTSHPSYLEVAEKFVAGAVSPWEQRGPPDHFEKLDGQWVCE